MSAAKASIVLLAAVLAFALVGSRLTGPPAHHRAIETRIVRATSALTVVRVTPSVTSSSVGAPNSPNVAVVDRATRSIGELFVFFPGTGGQPSCCTDVLDTAAEAGFHAIGLTYANGTAVGTICRNDLACYGTVRHDDFDGSEPNRYVTVARTNAIQARLVALLRWLAAHDASDGWSQFLAGNSPAWSHIVVAGHSQGGGDAAFIAKIRRVEGVVMLSSVVDASSSVPPVPASYLTTGHLTPASRYTGFVHTGDPFFGKITTDWKALTLPSFGGAISVDGNHTPFGHTHELVTSAAPRAGPLPALANHDATAVDSQTPLCTNGTRAYAPVWRYLVQVAGGLPVTGNVTLCSNG